ncbi:MAG TPA: SGNH/GDSL hydrolase family protein [Terriglobia bacterium]|nr:SGNH/GDSL hydrolase family protein [Terriglobia bacterium]
MKRTWIRSGGLLLLSTVLSLLLCEGVLRWIQASRWSQTFYIWPPHMHAVFDPLKGLYVGISGRSHFIVNRDGFRGDERSPDDRFRILTVGGSTTECSMLDQPKTWPYLLQVELSHRLSAPVWVGNAGRSGDTTHHHVTAIRYLPLEDLDIHLVLLLVGVNDLSKRLSKDTQYDPFYMDRPGTEEELIAQTFQGSFRPNPNDPLYKRTAIWQTLMRLRPILRRGHVQDKAGRVMNLWRSHRQGASEYRDELPDLTSALDEFASNIGRIVDLGRKRGVQTVFMTQPCLWRSDLTAEETALLWFGGVGDFQQLEHQPYYTVKTLMEAMAMYNDRLKQVCRQHEVPCLDLASLIPSDTTCFYDDVHFNEGGARQVAHHVANYLLSHELLVASSQRAGGYHSPPETEKMTGTQQSSGSSR